MYLRYLQATQPVTLSRNFYFGIFSYHDSYGNCIAWSDASDFTTAWSFARAMAILATVCGTIAFAFTLSLSCVSMPNLILKLMSLTYLAAGLCAILTMVANAEFEDCALARGVFFAVVAIIFKIPLYSGATSTKGSKSNDVTVTITEPRDGTKKTVKMMIDKNGNKTTDETLEPRPSEESEDEEDVEVGYLPVGSIKTTRICIYDKDGEDGAKVVHEPRLSMKLLNGLLKPDFVHNEDRSR